MGFIKICGITKLEDAKVAIESGATAIGLNLWSESPRCVDVYTAKKIMDAVRGKIKCVLVTVDFEVAILQKIISELQPDWLQLHGHEADETVQDLQPYAFKAVGLAMQRDVDKALAVPGKYVLVDNYDGELQGGTGQTPPANLAGAVCRARRTILAGGLGVDNVASSIAALRPYGVDASSRLESSPGNKDANLVRKFVEEAKKAFDQLGKR